MSSQSICFPPPNKLYECLRQRSQRHVTDVTKPAEELGDDIVADIFIQKGIVRFARKFGGQCIAARDLEQLKADALEETFRFAQVDRTEEIAVHKLATEIFQTLRRCAHK